ncbi:hypothetical protein ASC97_08700 [Rhizobium sp. Root1203]|uniref:hypothetical protein n=1 Tax=Rhizobium sp. Root1203 TaxID=1736427 RepID=UPI0007106962|nr:hypothetical protein [Rhizobium sp. Root1203]KQV28391.1 hypothetical protein ASC97_08700 [Rhizobium sp. Root1203]
MQTAGEMMLKKPSALSVPERRVLIDHLATTIVKLTHGLAEAGQLELLPAMLETKETLRRLTDDLAVTNTDYSDRIIAGAVQLVATTEALLEDEFLSYTIH